MLKEIAPRLERVAVVANPKTTPYDYFFRAAEAIAPSLAIKMVPSPVATASDIELAIESVAGASNGGLLLPPDGTTILHRDLVIALAARHKLPAVYAFDFFVAAGGLMSYATDQDEVFRLAASMLTAFCAATNPPTSRYRRRPNSEQPSTLERRGRSTSPFLRGCWSPLTK